MVAYTVGTHGVAIHGVFCLILSCMAITSLRRSLASFVTIAVTSLVKSSKQNTQLICVERAYRRLWFFITRFKAVKALIHSLIKVGY